jgi:hypothetical protein
MTNIETVNGRSARRFAPRDPAPGTVASSGKVSGGRPPPFGVARGLGSTRPIPLSEDAICPRTASNPPSQRSKSQCHCSN